MNSYCFTILDLNIDEAKELFPPIFHLLSFFANSTIFMSFKRNRNSCSVPSYTHLGLPSNLLTFQAIKLATPYILKIKIIMK